MANMYSRGSMKQVHGLHIINSYKRNMLFIKLAGQLTIVAIVLSFKGGILYTTCPLLQ